jgi:hypothetical protein
MTWISLAAFSQIYGERQEQKAEQKNLKNLQFGQKRTPLKLGPRKV